MSAARTRVLRFLQHHPHAWHYGLDIAEEAHVSRASIYIYLGSLEEDGFVDRRHEPGPVPHGGMPRTQYRITRSGMTEPTDQFDGALEPSR
jgi:DNA-binding PadR family transcriptional regulator